MICGGGGGVEREICISGQAEQDVSLFTCHSTRNHFSLLKSNRTVSPLSAPLRITFISNPIKHHEA